MKNFTLLLTTILLFALASCTQKANILIKGTIDASISELEGRTLELTVKNKKDTVVLKGIVLNNRFEICGHIDEAQWTIVRWEDVPAFMLVLEKGNITIDIKQEDGEKYVRTGGTENNRLLQAFADDLNEVLKDISAIEKEDEDLAYDMYYSFLQGQIAPIINTEAGKCLFRSYYYLFTMDDIDAFFAGMTEETLKDENIKRIHSAFELQKATAEGKDFTDFAALTPEGETLALSEIVGQKAFVLVDFWASWCGPCRRSMPQMKELYRKYNNALEILGVSLDDDKDAWLGAIKSMELTWKHISDLKGWESEPAKKYGVRSIPCTILINSEGKIVGRNIAHERIAEIIDEATATAK